MRDLLHFEDARGNKFIETRTVTFLEFMCCIVLHACAANRRVRRATSCRSAQVAMTMLDYDDIRG